jgi:opacity protein-like surface antigen
MRSLLALALAGALMARPVGAQTPNPVLMSISAGGAMPTGDLSDVANTGFNIAGSAEFSPTSIPFSLRIDLGYTKFGEKQVTVSDGTETFEIESNFSNFAGTFNAVFGGRSQAQVRPYAIAGVGFYNTKIDVSVSGTGGSFSGDDTEGSLGFNGGAGLRFRIGTLSTFVEGRYHYVLKGGPNTDPESEDLFDAAGYFPIVFGISFGR